jgi:hypothetical protein
MMAAVANIEGLATRDNRARKSPCTAVLSYNATELADG